MKKNNGIKAIIWDMGGVLLRTIDWTPRKQLAERFGMTENELMDLVFHSDTAIRAEMGQVSFEEHWENVLRKLDLGMDSLQWFLEAFFQGDEIDNDLLNIIRYLRSEYRVGLLSNALPKARVMLAEMYDFLDDFDDTIFSSEVGIRKPDPRIYQVALERLEVSGHEAIFVDDMLENVTAAEKAQMIGILFKNPSQAINDLQKYLGEIFY